MPPAINHIVITGSAIIAILLGGIFIDLDHKGSLECRLKNIFKFDKNCKVGPGFIHENPTLMFSIIAFSLFFSLSLILHYALDLMRFLR